MKVSTKAIHFLESRSIPEGPKAGDKVKLAPFQKQFVRGALDPAINVAILSIGRGNAKTALSAGIALGSVMGHWDNQPRREIVIAARVRDHHPLKARIRHAHTEPSQAGLVLFEKVRCVMNREEFETLDKHIEARAARMWSEAGSPDGGSALFMDQARELVAIEEVEPATLNPREAAPPVIEEASIQSNLGEFPTLRDQGDEMTFPDINHDHSAEDDTHLSDGDASDNGGVLPEEDTVDDDLPDVSLADGDITASSLDADDEPLNDDLNDDGLPDNHP